MLKHYKVFTHMEKLNTSMLEQILKYKKIMKD